MSNLYEKDRFQIIGIQHFPHVTKIIVVLSLCLIRYFVIYTFRFIMTRIILIKLSFSPWSLGKFIFRVCGCVCVCVIEIFLEQ